MRLLREVDDERTARLVEDALYHRGIASNVSHSQSGTFLVWVVDEAELERAAQLTQIWLDEGQARELNEIAQRGRLEKDEIARTTQERRQQIATARRELARALTPRPTPLTWGLTALCVAIFWLSGAPSLGLDRDALDRVLSVLAIVDPQARVTPITHTVLGVELTLHALPWYEPWRFFTPALVHFDVLSLLFNLVVLAQLGRVLEMRHGSGSLFLVAVASACVGNVAQLVLTGTPIFGGFSSVVFGALGFLWVRGKVDPTVGYRLTQGALTFMLAVLAFSFVIGLRQTHVPAYANAFSLLTGMASAALAPRRKLRI